MEPVLPQPEEIETTFHFLCKQANFDKIKLLLKHYFVTETLLVDKCFMYAINHNFIDVTECLIQIYQENNEDLSGLVGSSLTKIIRDKCIDMFELVFKHDIVDIDNDNIDTMCRYNSVDILTKTIKDMPGLFMDSDTLSKRLITCVQNNSEITLECLLKLPEAKRCFNVYNAPKNRKFVQLMFANASEELIMMLIKFCKLHNKILFMKDALGYSIMYNRANIFFDLMKDSEIIDRSDYNFTIECNASTGIFCNNNMYLDYLITNQYPEILEKRHLERLLYRSVECNNYNTVKFIFSRTLVNMNILTTKSNRNRSLYGTITSRDMNDILSLFMDFDVNIHEYYRKNMILPYLSQHGHTALFKGLITYRILSRAQETLDLCFYNAVNYGNLDILDYLLSEPIDPNVKITYCSSNEHRIHFTHANDYDDTIEDDDDYDDTLLSLAVQQGKSRIVQRLLEDERIDPAESFFDIMNRVAFVDNDTIFQLLVNDPRILDNVEEWVEPFIKIEYSRYERLCAGYVKDLHYHRIINAISFIKGIYPLQENNTINSDCFCMESESVTEKYMFQCGQCKKYMHLMCIIPWFIKRHNLQTDYIGFDSIDLDGTCPFCVHPIEIVKNPESYSIFKI